VQAEVVPGFVGVHEHVALAGGLMMAPMAPPGPPRVVPAVGCSAIDFIWQSHKSCSCRKPWP
jgi:hypothetical protein